MIFWSPRTIMTGRLFRLPVSGKDRPTLAADHFELVDERWSPRDAAWMFYLRSPARSGDYDIVATNTAGESSIVTVRVRNLHQLRQPIDDDGTVWPRRWPVGADWSSRKSRQTLQQHSPTTTVDAERLVWWTSQDDRSLWRQLPDAECPRAHYVNVHQGCPACGTAIFAHHGYYPWTRIHAPADLRSTCPACAAVFPSNDLLSEDFSHGDFVDDGFGYFDAAGHVFLFAASSRRELVGHYTSAIRLLDDHLRVSGPDLAVTRQLGLMLLRWSMEEVYVAAAPQFRHGPSQEIERPWDRGQPDWAGMEDPIASLHRKGSLAYAIDVPIVTEILARAYDTAWPQLLEDDEWIARARPQGLELADAAAGIQLIEEALSCLMQTAIDGAALSNKPRTSLGVLTALQALDRDDATDVMDWLYDRGPDRLRVFVTNNFTVDGAPPEATGGYNDTHTRGVFELQEQVNALRQLHPGAYPASLYPSVTDDPRLDRLVRSPYEMVLLGRVPFHFGDGGSSGVQTPFEEGHPLAPLDEQTLERATAAGSTSAPALLARQRAREHHPASTTIHDGVGIAILRTDGAPETAAAGLVYGDAPWHRHQDLLDLQVYAFGRPFLSDLGYPQSWAHVGAWEGNWATHNSVWSVVDDLQPLDLPFDTPWHFHKEIAGRGRIVRSLRAEGVQIIDVEARRWAFDPERMRWHDPVVRYRRLLALIESDGEGIVIVDLSRIRGGDEHWRICRGLEGTFSQQGIEPVGLAGTLAGPDVMRGETDRIAHGDHAGLAWMDEVARFGAGGRPGRWSSRHDPAAHLDLYQVHVSDGTSLHGARATAVMDTPERSRYDYRALAWRRDQPGNSTTKIDLVFEPHLGQPTLTRVEAIEPDSANAHPANAHSANTDSSRVDSSRVDSSCGDSSCGESSGFDAGGVKLTTRAGRTLSLYWAPDSPPDGETRFSDGTTLHGALAFVEADRVTMVGCDGLSRVDAQASGGTSRMETTILGLDRAACTIDIDGLAGIAPQDRICINPAGRGHTYEVLAVERTGARHHRLTLDMASVHGRGRVASIEGDQIELDFHLITRTAHLLSTRLQREADDTWQEITHACNRDAYSTTIEVSDTEAQSVDVGDWVAAVDYVEGDLVRWEPLRTGNLT